MPDTTTEPAEPVETAEPRTTTGTSTENGTSTTEPDETADGASREAARYRKALRAAEVARDGLQARVTAFQRAEVERLAAGPGRLLDAGDLWRVADLPDLLVDGDVDPTKVAAAVEQLVQQKPHYGQPLPVPDGLDLGVRGVVQQKPTTWAEVISAS